MTTKFGRSSLILSATARKASAVSESSATLFTCQVNPGVSDPAQTPGYNWIHNQEPIHEYQDTGIRVCLIHTGEDSCVPTGHATRSHITSTTTYMSLCMSHLNRWRIVAPRKIVLSMHPLALAAMYHWGLVFLQCVWPGTSEDEGRYIRPDEAVQI
jgi:hypothetical protein